MSNIKSSGFYIIDKTFLNEVNIERDIYTSLFIGDFENDLVINLRENSKLDLYGFFCDIAPKNIIINQDFDNSKLNFKAIFINKNSDLNSNISSNISSNNSTSKINIIGVVKENKIGIDSNITIKKDYKNIEAHLDLENIFIGKNGSINSIPNLFVSSKDVKVSHSSKSHRLDETKLFYLKSRGLDEKNSIKIILESYFRKTFSCIEMFDKNVFENTFKEFVNLNVKEK
ncbi:MAG: SufD family Fe-S cluster assembly protein [Candidatus Gracilibacteria bacterium]|nr:SufD family Fe-S cluster assembly protein [Candidatus Gracilibacteria bacterium]